MKYFKTYGLLLIAFNVLLVVSRGICKVSQEKCKVMFNNLPVFKKCISDKNCPKGLHCSENPCLAKKQKICMLNSGKALVCPNKSKDSGRCTIRDKLLREKAITRCVSHSKCKGKLLCCKSECSPKIFQCMRGVVDEKLVCPKHNPKLSCKSKTILKNRYETCRSNEDCQGHSVCCKTQCFKGKRHCVKGVPVSKLRKPTTKKSKVTPISKRNPTQKPITTSTSKQIHGFQTTGLSESEISDTMSTIPSLSTTELYLNTETIPSAMITTTLKSTAIFQDYVEVCPMGCAKDGNFIINAIQTCEADSECPQKHKCCYDACWTESNICKPVSIIYNITIPGGKCRDDCLKDQVPFPPSVMICDDNAECGSNLECCLDQCYETNLCKPLVYK